MDTMDSLGAGYDMPINGTTLKEDEGMNPPPNSVSIPIAPYKSNLAKVIQDGFNYTYTSKRKPLLSQQDEEDDE